MVSEHWDSTWKRYLKIMNCWTKLLLWYKGQYWWAAKVLSEESYLFLSKEKIMNRLFYTSKGLTLTKVSLLMVFLETSGQIWVNFSDSDLKSLIFLFIFKSLPRCRFGGFLNSFTPNFNLVSELQACALKFCYDAKKEEVERLQIHKWGSDIPLSPLHGIPSPRVQRSVC